MYQGLVKGREDERRAAMENFDAGLRLAQHNLTQRISLSNLAETEATRPFRIETARMGIEDIQRYRGVWDNIKNTDPNRYTQLSEMLAGAKTNDDLEAARKGVGLDILEKDLKMTTAAQQARVLTIQKLLAEGVTPEQIKRGTNVTQYDLDAATHVHNMTRAIHGREQDIAAMGASASGTERLVQTFTNAAQIGTPARSTIQRLFQNYPNIGKNAIQDVEGVQWDDRKGWMVQLTKQADQVGQRLTPLSDFLPPPLAARANNQTRQDMAMGAAAGGSVPGGAGAKAGGSGLAVDASSERDMTRVQGPQPNTLEMFESPPSGETEAGNQTDEEQVQAIQDQSWYRYPQGLRTIPDPEYIPSVAGRIAEGYKNQGVLGAIGSGIYGVTGLGYLQNKMEKFLAESVTPMSLGNRKPEVTASQLLDALDRKTPGKKITLANLVKSWGGKDKGDDELGKEATTIALFKVVESLAKLDDGDSALETFKDRLEEHEKFGDITTDQKQRLSNLVDVALANRANYLSHNRAMLPTKLQMDRIRRDWEPYKFLARTGWIAEWLGGMRGRGPVEKRGRRPAYSGLTFTGYES